MKYSFVTLFPESIAPYFDVSILGRAKNEGYIHTDFISPRTFSTNKHAKTDDYAIGGGAGLVFTPQPLFACLSSVIARSPESYVIFTTPAAKPFRHADAKRLSEKKHIVFVCGRYEGIDERIIEQFADEQFSVGDYILTGGELAATVMSDAISRFIPGVLGNSESAVIESFEDGLLEAPTFTKPHCFRNMPSPSILLKGNHAKIADFKKGMSVALTKYFRVDLYGKFLRRKENEK